VVVAPSVTERDVSVTNMPTAAGAVTRLQITNNTAIAASDWAASTAYAAGAVVLRTSGIGAESTAGLYMRCTTGGTSNTLEPTWDTTVGNTSADTNGTGAGDVIWTTYAILYYDADPVTSSLVTTYENGEEFVDGETFGVRFAELDGATSFKGDNAVGLTTTTGLTALMAPVADTVYALNAIDGTTVTELSGDYTNNELDVVADTDSSPERAFAAYCNILAASSTGMYRFWGSVDAIDQGNYRNNVAVLDIFFDSTINFSVSFQGTGARWFKSDGSNPEKIPTTSGYGVSITWELPVSVVETGSVTAATIWAYGTRTLTSASNITSDGVAINTTAGVIDTVTANSDMRGTDGANTTTPPTAAANAAAVQASAITTPLPSNAKQMNDATIYGDGTVNDKWTGEAP